MKTHFRFLKIKNELRATWASRGLTIKNNWISAKFYFFLKKKKIAPGDINIFRHLLLSFFEIFQTKPGVSSSTEKNIIGSVFSTSELVQVDTSLAYIVLIMVTNYRTRGS